MNIWGTKKENGFTILELIVGIGLSSIILTALAFEYANISKIFYDLSIKDSVQVEAELISKVMISDIKEIGIGLPVYQRNFQIGEDALSDPSVTLPIASSSGASSITFKKKKSKESKLLSQNFDPSSNTTVYLDNVDGIIIGNIFCVSNISSGGEDANCSDITAINTSLKTLTLANSVYSLNAVFEAGDLVNILEEITYQSNPLTNVVTRTDSNGQITLSENAIFTLKYLDTNLSMQPTPLDATSISETIRSVKITVTTESNQVLTTGDTYSYSLSKIISLGEII